VGLALARDEREVPGPDPRWRYEPKFDGWRAAVFTASGVVQSRRDNDLAARFPEVVVAVRGLGDLLLDGELVALRDGRLDFGALTSMPRARAAAGIDIYFIAFDLLADGVEDLRPLHYRERRHRLVSLLAGVAPPLQLTPATENRDEAMTWMRPEVADVGIEGVVAKQVDRPYRAGRTGDWRKTRQTIVVDAVVVGVAGATSRPEALVLARPDEEGELRVVGLSLPLAPALRDIAAPLVHPTDQPRRRLPGAVLGQRGTEYQPVRPTVVVEVEAEATVLSFNARLRPRVTRIRTELTPADVRSSRG
jgi:ATP-dependent DNA ligase